MSDTENPLPILEPDASGTEGCEQLAPPVRRRGWFAELLIYLLIIAAGGLLAVVSDYLMRKFGL